MVGEKGVVLLPIQARRRSAPCLGIPRWLCLVTDSGLAGLEGAPWRTHRPIAPTCGAEPPPPAPRP